jgi:hypothetical protein
LCGFVSATVWAGVVATQRPIACPNRQLPPERYTQWCLRFIDNYIKMILDVNRKRGYNEIDYGEVNEVSCY